MVLGQADYLGQKFLTGVGEATKDLSPLKLLHKEQNFDKVEMDSDENVLSLSYWLYIWSIEQAGG